MKRISTVVLAVLLAVLGTAGVLAYVHQADARAVAGMRAVTVLLARQEIPSGTSASTALQDGLLTSQTLPASSVPSDAVRSITPDLGALVVSANVQPGQLLLRPMLVTAAQVTGGLAIPRGMIAVTIALCVPEAVAGNIGAGSEVAVFDTFATGQSQSLTASQGCSGQHQQQAVSTAHTQMVVPQAEVLSLGVASANGTGPSSATSAQTSNSAASGQGSTLVTLAVDQADAEKLIQLTETGLPYLALLTSSSQISADSTSAPQSQP